MNDRRWKPAAEVICLVAMLAASVAVCFAGQAAPPADVGAQIDALLKKEIEETNIQGRLTDALALAQQAVDLSRKLGDTKRLMHSLDALSAANFYNGRLQDALGAAREETALARELNDTFWLCRSFGNQATPLRNLGRYEEALGAYNQTMVLARQLNNPVILWALNRNISVMYAEMGDLDKAEAPLKESLAIAREMKQEPLKSKFKGWGQIGEAASLETLGNWEICRKHYPAAIDYLEQSLATSPDNPGFKAEILNNLAAAYELSGNSQRSAEIQQQALQFLATTGSTPNPIMISNLAFSEEHLGQLKKALAGEERALSLVHESGGNLEYEWSILSRLGHVERALGHTKEALADYERAIADIERVNAGALNTEFGRAAVLQKSHDAFTETADLLLEMHRAGEGLEIAERGRARAFLDILAQARAGLPDELTADQRKREAAILARISTTQARLWKGNVAPDQRKQGEAELAAAEADLEAFHLEVRQSNPRYASLQYPEPIRVAEIQGRLLDTRTALVEYLLGERRSLVWVVTKDKVFATVLPPRQEIEREVAEYREVLTRRASTLLLDQSQAEIARRGAQLYNSLFLPIQMEVAGRQRLVIIPDGILNYLPFDALVEPTASGASQSSAPSYLAEKYVIVYGPSASALVTVRTLNRATTEPSKMLLAIGDPRWSEPSALPATASQARDERSTEAAQENSPGADYVERGFSFSRLPYTRREVLGIGQLFPESERRLFLGAGATVGAVEAEKLDRFRYIHFATHSFIDETAPYRSGILLSHSPESSGVGMLQMNEILRLKLNADLVTLSACSTGLGKVEGGEGILGLTRAFFYAGARNLTVSLWDVNDSATATLMKAYYENLNRGLPAGAALRRAKLSMIRGKIALWRHPYFWAPFVVVGEGGSSEPVGATRAKASAAIVSSKMSDKR